jgi:hypothetical protein
MQIFLGLLCTSSPPLPFPFSNQCNDEKRHYRPQRKVYSLFRLLRSLVVIIHYSETVQAHQVVCSVSVLRGEDRTYLSYGDHVMVFGTS